MTKYEAGELALEILNYYLEHPEADCKKKLPPPLYGKIWHFMNCCPMCALFFVVLDGVSCPDCPLRAPGWRCASFKPKDIQKNIDLIKEWMNESND